MKDGTTNGKTRSSPVRLFLYALLSLFASSFFSEVMASQAIGVAVFPSLLYVSPEQIERRHKSAAANLAQARAEAREYGWQRRAEIRRRVREHQDEERKGNDT